MKTRTILAAMTVLCLANPMRSFATVNVDSSDNYSGGWTNGSNGGGGFGAWSNVAVSGSGWAGNGIWNSTNAGLNLGESFGYQARGSGAYVTMSRNFSTALATGDTFSLEFGLNYDTGNPAGNKGFVLYTADNREIVVVNQSNTQNVAINGTAALTNYGTATMYWTFTQTSPTQVTVYATGRGGESEYVTRIVSASQTSYLAGIKFYASEITNDVYVEYRQVYFDNLTLDQGGGTNVFRYSIDSGHHAVVTSVLASATGDLVVPTTLGGYVVGAVGRAAFQDLTNVTGVSFASGANVTNVGPEAFQGCTALTNVALPDGLQELAAGLFCGCTALRAVTIPSGVTNVGDAAFADCRNLAAVSLPSGLAGLGESPFLNCRSLGEIDVPDGIASVPRQFCYECRSLASVDLPAGTTNIGSRAFFNCFGLTSLALDYELGAVGDYAFAGCDSLTKVSFNGSVAGLGTGAFADCPALTRVYFFCDAPTAGEDLFLGSDLAAVYYLVFPSSWSTTFGGVAAVEWAPEAVGGVASNGAFRFRLDWTDADGRTIQVQASPDLVAPAWQNVGTNVVIVSGTASIVDTNWTTTEERYYRYIVP